MVWAEKHYARNFIREGTGTISYLFYSMFMMAIEFKTVSRRPRKKHFERKKNALKRSKFPDIALLLPLFSVLLHSHNFYIVEYCYYQFTNFLK